MLRASMRDEEKEREEEEEEKSTRAKRAKKTKRKKRSRRKRKSHEREVEIVGEGENLVHVGVGWAQEDARLLLQLVIFLKAGLVHLSLKKRKV